MRKPQSQEGSMSKPLHIEVEARFSEVLKNPGVREAIEVYEACRKAAAQMPDILSGDDAYFISVSDSCNSYLNG